MLQLELIVVAVNCFLPLQVHDKENFGETAEEVRFNQHSCEFDVCSTEQN